jgi:hypothetical protein
LGSLMLMASLFPLEATGLRGTAYTAVFRKEGR